MRTSFCRLLIVLALIMGSLPGATTLVAQEAPPPPTVNVEIILDSSGSMANLTNTGEIRMDAAKRVLSEVINSIPEREGSINVGLRIYGHKGDNSEATKEESCAASELLVAVEGVNKTALLAAVDSAQPTGWTPLGRSIARAGKDLEKSPKASVNAVVVVTDGVETCDRDPVAEAAKIHQDSAIQATTYVIGFGTTPEEQAVLQGIADAGGGQLFGAGSGTELRAALFSVLEELQIVVGAGYVGGNAFGLIPEGQLGTLSVVAYGMPIDTSFPTVPFVLRNNTGNDIVQPKVNLTVRDSAGTLIASGDAPQVYPFFVRSGGIAFGSIMFLGQGTVIPADATFEWSVSPTAPKDAQYYPYADMDIVEASLFDNRIVGTAKNGFEYDVSGPMLPAVLCMWEDGSVVSFENGFTDAGPIPSGATQSFQVDLFLTTYAGYGCPVFLVAAGANGKPRLPNATQAPRAAATQAPTAPPAETEPLPTATATDSTLGSSDGDSASCVTDATAEQILLQLQERGLPIGEYLVYTDETDPNKLLGRPGGYTSKVNFIDTRYTYQAVEFLVEEGGTIEVFPSETLAKARVDYIESLVLASPLFAEYYYQEGSVVLRLSKQLLPSEAAAFAEEFASVVHCSD